MTEAPAPIFVLCCARSGSTLLRYALDAHPEIVAPPELHLLLAARQLLWLFEHTARAPGRPAPDLDAKRYAADRARETLDAVMAEHAGRAGKRLWAEKSVSSVDCLDVLEVVFPDARLLCLHREAPDVMASCAQAARQRQGIFGFEGFVARTQANPIDGLADYWIDKTRRTLRAEHRLGNAHLRMRYEDLVRDPEPTLTALFEFLGLPRPKRMLDSIFAVDHVVGPGDSKILSTTGIHTDSIGHRARLAMHTLSDDRRRQIDELHETLGYPPLGSPN